MASIRGTDTAPDAVKNMREFFQSPEALIAREAMAVAYSGFFFEAFDEPWKGDPNSPMGAEKHLGAIFRRPHP